MGMKYFGFIALYVAVLSCNQAVMAQPCFQCMICDQYFVCSGGHSSGGLDCSIYSNMSCNLIGMCNLGGSGCFLPGSLVETDGGLKAIERLRAGDRVLGQYASGRMKVCDVERTYKSLQCSYYVINGRLRVTGTHPFFVDGRWVEASQINVGDLLKGKDSQWIEVETIEVVSKGVRVYNIEVADAHTFFVEGVLVHNKGPDPGLP